MSASVIAPFTDNVLPWMAERRALGRKTALASLVHVEGRAPRPLGSQLAIDETGEYVGLISGGCVEAALAREAVQALQRGENRLIRYGEGSAYIDIKLPCGSGIDIFIDAGFGDALLSEALALQEARKPFRLLINMRSGVSTISRDQVSVAGAADADIFTRYYAPAPIIHLFGDHPAAHATAGLLAIAGYRSEHSDAAEAAALAAHADEWSAAALFYHDHADEPGMLDALLTPPLFFLGAMGGRATHAQRLEALRARGRSEDALARIQGPIGEPIAAATPPEIGVAVTASIIKAWRHKLSEP